MVLMKTDDRLRWAATIACVCLLGPYATSAQALCEKVAPDPNQRYGVYSFQVENDLFTGTDAQYTNGIKAVWVSPNVKTFADPHLPCWMQHLNGTVERLFGVLRADDDKSRNMVVTFGQAMYTPADRARVSVDLNDRPYAGWTYLGLGYNARHEPPPASNGEQRTATMDTIEIDFGLVGPHAYAQQTQDAVHRLRGFALFQGWANQLRDEPGLQFVREQK